jgi:hypothetical protein
MSYEPDDNTDLPNDIPGDGCCMNCASAEPGCLCFDCQCSQCNYYTGDSCSIADNLREENYQRMASNLEIVFTTEYGNTLIQIKTIGPVVKSDYARFKPFLQAHSHYNFERQCYEVFSENWRFVRWLRMKASECGFSPTEKIKDVT